MREVVEAAWRAFEVIRVYRQLGTAQAIALLRHLLIAGLAEGYTTSQQWYAALDRALCDTVADQLQVLLPDEVSTLIWYATITADSFTTNYRRLLSELQQSSHRRLAAQIEALRAVVRNDGSPLITDTDIMGIINGDAPNIADEVITTAFRLDGPFFTLPQFARRLRAYKSDRGL